MRAFETWWKTSAAPSPAEKTEMVDALIEVFKEMAKEAYEAGYKAREEDEHDEIHGGPAAS